MKRMQWWCVALAVAVVACSESPERGLAPGSLPPMSLRAVIPVSAIRRPQEEKFERLSASVPAFSGYYYERGDLVVALTDTSQATRALSVIAREGTGAAASGHKGLGRSGRTRIELASFSFTQLKAWRDALFGELIESDSVEYLDLDERTNRVTVGINDPHVTAWVAQVAAKHGLPSRALAIDTTVALQSFATLTDRVRPLRGGLQINRRGNTACTVGFVVQHVLDNGFLTASHCTSAFWGQDVSTQFQIALTAADSVGREVHDPPGFACGFRGRKTCRYSDAALIGRVTSDRLQGRVLRLTETIYDQSQFGSTQILASSPHWTVSAMSNGVTVGDQLDKVGITTGWTSGAVTRTCVDTKSRDNGERYRALCLDESRTLSFFGDSGAPAFIFLPTNTLEAHGLIQGGRIFAIRPALTYISPIENIILDLGGLSAVAP